MSDIFSITTNQFRLEKACKETEGKYSFNEPLRLAVCQFNSFKVEIDNQDEVLFDSPVAWVRLSNLENLDNMFVKGIARSGQGIWFKTPKNYAEIGPSGWHVTERREMIKDNTSLLEAIEGKDEKKTDELMKRAEGGEIIRIM